MQVIISGGTGLIGRALTDELLSAGHSVVWLSRNPSKARNIPPGVRIERWNVRSDDPWSALINRDTAIVNLAGESIGIPPLPWTDARKARLRESRLAAGRAVVAAVSQAPARPRVVIQSSGVGYYGLRGDEPLDENAPAGNDFLARLAIDWEATTTDVEALGVRRAVIRIGAVLSRTGGMLPYLTLPFRFFVGGPIGSGKQWLSWIHIADAAGAIRFLIENDAARGVFNLTSPDPLTNAAFGRVVGRVLHRPAFFPTPAFALKLVFGELADYLLLGGQRVLPERLLAAGYRFRFADAESALRALLKG